jgi:hypothetical protein
MPPRLVVRYAGAFLLYQLGVTLSALRHSAGAAARARLRGQLAGLRSVPIFLAKRRLRRQTVPDPQFARLLRHS